MPQIGAKTMVCVMDQEEVVHPDYLRKGIGSKMLDFAEQTGKKEKVEYLRLYVYEKNDVAIKTYEKNGYTCIDKVDIGLGEYGLKWFCLYEKEVAGKKQKRNFGG